MGREFERWDFQGLPLCDTVAGYRAYLWQLSEVDSPPKSILWHLRLQGRLPIHRPTPASILRVMGTPASSLKLSLQGVRVHSMVFLGLHCQELGSSWPLWRWSGERTWSLHTSLGTSAQVSGIAGRAGLTDCRSPSEHSLLPFLLMLLPPLVRAVQRKLSPGAVSLHPGIRPDRGSLASHDALELKDTP